MFIFTVILSFLLGSSVCCRSLFHSVFFPRPFKSFSGKLTYHLLELVELFESLVFICGENPRRSGILPFADHPRFCQYIGYSQEAVPDFPDRGTGAQQFRGLVMS